MWVARHAAAGAAKHSPSNIGKTGAPCGALVSFGNHPFDRYTPEHVSPRITMARFRHLALPGYGIATMLILIPLADTVVGTLPLRAGDVAWRFGAAGLFSRAIMTPLLGLFLCAAIAAALDHRRVIRVVAVMSGVTALLLMGVVGLFMLDALQMRSQVRPDAKPAFDTATALALAKYGAGILLLTVFAIRAWKASRKVAQRRTASLAAADAVRPRIPGGEGAGGLPVLTN